MIKELQKFTIKTRGFGGDVMGKGYFCKRTIVGTTGL
jgi:hypothetical protein